MVRAASWTALVGFSVTIVILFVSLCRRMAGGGGGKAAWFLCTARVLRAEFVA